MSLIEVKGLKKSFGSLEVLKGIDLTVEQGERIAIIGGSGCGKSVFLRSLCLLEKPDAGQILIDGQEITAKGANVDQIRRSMGMVFQKFHLFSEMDVMDNLCLAPTRLRGMSREEAEEKAKELKNTATQYYFNVGERVFHEKLGIGHITDVIQIGESTMYTIDFGKLGKKAMDASYAHLKKF